MAACVDACRLKDPESTICKAALSFNHRVYRHRPGSQQTLPGVFTDKGPYTATLEHSYMTGWEKTPPPLTLVRTWHLLARSTGRCQTVSCL